MCEREREIERERERKRERERERERLGGGGERDWEGGREREIDCVYYIFVQMCDLGLHSRRLPTAK